MTDEHPLFQLAKELRYECTAMQGKISDLLALLADLNLPEPSRRTCPECGLQLPGEHKLAEHLYLSHDGKDPEHWLEAEAKADLS